MAYLKSESPMICCFKKNRLFVLNLSVFYEFSGDLMTQIFRLKVVTKNPVGLTYIVTRSLEHNVHTLFVLLTRHQSKHSVLSNCFDCKKWNFDTNIYLITRVYSLAHSEVGDSEYCNAWQSHCCNRNVCHFMCCVNKRESSMNTVVTLFYRQSNCHHCNSSISFIVDSSNLFINKTNEWRWCRKHASKSMLSSFSNFPTDSQIQFQSLLRLWNGWELYSIERCILLTMVHCIDSHGLVICHFVSSDPTVYVHTTSDYYVKNVAEIGQFKLTVIAAIYINVGRRDGSRILNKIRMNWATH